MRPESRDLSTRQIDPNYLIGAIEGDGGLEQLTAVRMALKDLKNGDIDTAIFRLKQDLDKIRGLNYDLYQYLIDRILRNTEE